MPSTVMASQFNNDSFYYLNVASNYSTKGYTSYDGDYSTNGYQFLWQFLLNQTISGTEDQSLQIKYTFWLCMLLTTLSYILLFLSIYRLTGSNIMSVITIIPGFFYLSFDKLIGWNYSPWALINGMESSLGLLVFAIILLLFTFRNIEKDLTKPYLLLVGAVISLLILTRLDEAFLLFAIILTLVMSEQKKEKVRSAIFLSTIPILVIITYIVYNYSTYGLALPVSGLSKSDFYPKNLLHLLHSIYTGRSFDFLFGEHLYSRVLPLLIPLLVVVLLSKKLLSNSYFSFNDKFVYLIKTLKYYVIFKSLYLLFFVDFWKQGFWYMFIPVVIMNLFVIMWFKTILGERINSNGFQLISIIIILVLTNGYYLDAENISKQKIQSGKLDFYTISQTIDSTIGDKKIVEIDDGIIAYSVRNKCLSGTGLSLDKEAFEYNKSGRLLELAEKRGYEYIASVNYFKRPEFIADTMHSSSDFFEVSIDRKFYEESRKYRFTKVLADNRTGLVIIKFSKK
jgi:hypothetical protein